MILSFHPCIAADKNRICAGRDPDATDLALVKAVDAVILPQGCSRLLYEMTRRHCRHIFPDYDARFTYPDKISQIRLFEKSAVLFPETETFTNVAAFAEKYGRRPYQVRFEYPYVFKFNWGGEGETVCRIACGQDLLNILEIARKYEKTGQSGFLLQKYYRTGNRSLRVVVIGDTFHSYWRIQQENINFIAGVSRGAAIDSVLDKDLQNIGIDTVKFFCKKTGINLAGFDLIFSSEAVAGNEMKQPLLLEINYFFGRKGLGGSNRYYAMLDEAVQRWIDGLGLSGGADHGETGRTLVARS